MGLFVVIDEAGPAWDDKCPMREQKGWNEHAVFMDALADEHFDSRWSVEYSRHRAMLICTAPN